MSLLKKISIVSIDKATQIRLSEGEEGEKGVSKLRRLLTRSQHSDRGVLTSGSKQNEIDSLSAKTALNGPPLAPYLAYKSTFGRSEEDQERERSLHN